MTKFMKQKGKFNYYTSEELRAHVLQMPYKGEDISMIIIQVVAEIWISNSKKKGKLRIGKMCRVV